MIPRYYVIAERDHEHQSPTSVEKVHERAKRAYLHHERDVVGWTIFVRRTPPTRI